MIYAPGLWLTPGLWLILGLVLGWLLCRAGVG